MGAFAPERIKRRLTLAEAACLWVDLPFSALRTAIDMPDGSIVSLDHPELTNAFQALVDATDTMELYGGRDEDGHPLPLPLREVTRDDLKRWILQHHPHRPRLLFGVEVSQSRAVQPHSVVAGTAYHPGTDQAKLNHPGGPPTSGRLEEHELIGARDLCELLGISRNTLDAWLAQGKFPLPALQVGPRGA
ncbi:MAG: hypothetical protein N2441_03445, partial [Rhodocyclaceae bacterium]|nr:hypothetical protein [Rhodocyclaceae bacterium]